MADTRGGEREALQLVHHHPGRLRLRARAFLDHVETVADVRDRLEEMPGVVSIEHNPRTGSLLLVYEPGIVEPDVLVAAVADAAGLDLPREIPRDANKPAIVTIEVMRELNGAVQELTGRRVDLKTVVPAALMGVAFYSFAKHPDSRLPRWDNLVWWSYSLFHNFFRREIDPEVGKSEEGELQ
jgi:hypothetical protein